MMMVMGSSVSLHHIADGRHLPARGSVLKNRGKRIQLRGHVGVALRLSRLCGVLQVRRDLRSDLLELAGVLLLQLLQRGHHLRKGRKLVAVGRHGQRGCAGAGRAAAGARRAGRVCAARGPR